MIAFVAVHVATRLGRGRSPLSAAAGVVGLVAVEWLLVCSAAREVHLGELNPGSNAQLAEDLVQVVFDGAPAEEQLGCDIGVACPFPCESCDLQFLGGELVGAAWIP